MKLLIAIMFSTYSVWSMACTSNLRRHPEACKMQENYQYLKKAFASNYGVDIEDITRYRALRFFSSGHWDRVKEQSEFLIWMADKRDAPKTMMLWERGASYLESNWESYLSVGGLSIRHLQAMNEQTMHPDFMSWKSKWIKWNSPGEVRSGYFKQSPGWVAKCGEWPISEAELRHFQNYDLKTSEGEPYVWVNKKPKECKKKPGYYHANIRYLKSRYVEDELKRWVNRFNSNWSLVQSGRSSLDPISFIADFQREFISIHPFGDGNGRVIRFLQDLVAKKLGLPFIPTGKLQNDIGSTTGSYRELTKKEMKGQITFLESCFREYREKFQSNPEAISGDCRPAYKSISNEPGMEKKRLYVQALNSFFRTPISDIDDWFEDETKTYFPYELK